MAISPTVNNFMQQGNQTTQSDLSIFKNKFGKLAFDTLAGKFSILAKYVIMFKILDVDIEHSKGLGAFIIKYGADVLYLPVVLHNGSIISLETIYNKTEDTLVPLTKKYVDDIVNKNNVTSPTILEKSPYITSTRGLLHSMYKPPMSSGLAPLAAEDATAIPDEAKEAVINYLQSDKDTLAKIAEFYNIDVLLDKWNPYKNKTTKLAQETDKFKGFLKNTAIDLDKWKQMSKEAREAVPLDNKRELRENGFTIIKVAADLDIIHDNYNILVDTTKLETNLILRYNLQKINLAKSTGVGYFLSLKDYGFELIPFIVIKGMIITEGNWGHSSVVEAIVSNFKEYEITEDVLSKFGGVNLKDNIHNLSSIFTDDAPLKLFVYPVKSENIYSSCHSDYIKDYKVIDNSIYCNNDDLIFSDQIKKGKVATSDGNINVVILPLTTICICPSNKEAGRDFYKMQKCVQSFEQLYKHVTRLGNKLKIIPGTNSIRNLTTQETHTFDKKAEMAEFLMSPPYNMRPEDVSFFMDKKEALLLDKNLVKVAYFGMTQPVQTETPVQAGGEVASSLYSGYSPNYQQGTITQTAPGQTGAVQVDPAYIRAAADLGDESVLDTGILASLSGNEDIKVLLVDMLPKFQDTVTNLGRTLLQFCILKDTFEDTYGQEQYNTVLANIRKIFVMLGDLILDLKSFIRLN